MRILITGCGKIGKHAGLMLHKKGHEVFGLKRNTATLPESIFPIKADLGKPLDPGLLPAGIDQVIYILSASEFTQQAYRQAYVTGVNNLIAALQAADLRLQRFIFVSSTSVYGQHQGEWVDEYSACEPRSFNGRIMREAEARVLTLANSVVVRFSGIYGPGRRRMIDQVLTGQIAARQPVVYANRIHSEDCAAVLVHLLQQQNHTERIVVASDQHPATLHEIQTWLADKLHIPASQRHYLPPNNRAGSKRLCSRRLVNSGFSFKYPSYQSGYSELL